MKAIVYFLTASLSIVAACSQGGSPPQQDPRIRLFSKFNQATGYDEIKPMLSGVLAVQLEQIQAKNDSSMAKVLNRLKLASYDPRIVEINDNTSFLVLENARFTDGKSGRQAYLLTRLPARGWTLSNRVPPESIIKSLWIREYVPTEFNQPSSCAISGREFPPSINGKQWAMQSAVAFRDKDKIEINLYPFPVSKADLDYWKYSGTVHDQVGDQVGSASKPHDTCRIVFGLDPTGTIKFVNIGFDDPDLHTSTLWQSSEIPKVELDKGRIKIQTAGSVNAGSTVRWNCKIDVPLLDRGL